MIRTFVSRRLPAVLGAAAAVGALAVAAPSQSGAAPAPAAAPAAAAASNCPSAYPLKAVRRGLHATGYTTSQGRTPKPFSVNVLGVLKDGISPGIDLIVIRAHSPAIKRAGGVWAGMSGSPIYAPDGRLLGALSYSFSWGPSNTAGVTPAAAMYKLLGIGKHARYGATASHLRFSPAARASLVRTGAATTQQADGGMQFIPTPISVSGVPARGLAKVHKLMSKVVHGPFQLETGGTVSPNAKAPVSTIRPGAPFVASISTGDVTMAGIGTTTAVCNGRALAFGHPLLGGGATQVTAHTGNVLYIQPDPAESPFVMANVGGRTGVVNQDRLTGLRARLGAKPAHLTKIVTHVTTPSTGVHRTARSYTPLIGWVPDTAANAVYGTIITALEKFGTGTAKLGFAVLGRRAGGKPFHLRRSDYVASQYDVGYEAADQVYLPLAELAYNQFRHIHIRRVVVNARVSEKFREWSVQALQIRKNGHYVKAKRQRVVPGQTLHLRAKLQETNQIKPVRYVRYDVTVPRTARRFGYIEVAGGARGLRFVSGSSFNRLLHKLKHMPRNASLTFTSVFETRNGVVRKHRTVRFDRSVSGGKFVQLNTVPGPTKA
jgi:hypothetical protein